MAACKTGNSDFIFFLIREMSHYEHQPNLISFFQILTKGDHEKLTSHQQYINSQLAGLTPLMIASACGHTSVVDALLKCGADPNIETKDGWTAILFAVKHKHHDIKQLLTNSGTAPELVEKTKGNYSKIHISIF